MSVPGAAVTVVIPVWDGYVEFLADAVESVRRNSPRIPIIVVDNASSRFLPPLEGCEVVRSDRRLSVGAARNLGLTRAATEYVIFLDADDMLLEGAVEQLHHGIVTDPRLSIFAMLLLDGETGKRHRGPRRFVPALARAPRLLALADSIWSLMPIQGCAVLRTAQVRDAGGYADADSGEDWVLAVSLLWRGAATISPRLGLLYRAPEGPVRRPGRTAAELRQSARRVRDRMRGDRSVPRWARGLLPAIAILQLAAIYLARPAFVALRRFGARGPARATG